MSGLWRQPPPRLERKRRGAVRVSKQASNPLDTRQRSWSRSGGEGIWAVAVTVVFFYGGIECGLEIKVGYRRSRHSLSQRQESGRGKGGLLLEFFCGGEFVLLHLILIIYSLSLIFFVF